MQPVLPFPVARGLQFDLQTLMRRRRALKLFGGGIAGGAALVIVGCGDDGDDAATATTTATGTATAATATESQSSGTSTATATTSPIPTSETPASACNGALPEETAGPFPGDGSNGPNVLAESGIVRSDIRPSFGASSVVAEGVPLSVRLIVVDTANGCAPLAGAAVYAWHCDRDGGYSMYSAAVAGENYLRGVQPVGEEGTLEFITVFPGAYPGRWPHMHFEVYPSLFSAVEASGLMATSQLALPADACAAAYATSGYETSAGLLPSMSLDTDGIFRDGYRAQLASMSGTPGSDDFTASLTVAV